jgi:hypothetical protein
LDCFLKPALTAGDRRDLGPPDVCVWLEAKRHVTSQRQLGCEHRVRRCGRRVPTSRHPARSNVNRFSRPSPWSSTVAASPFRDTRALIGTAAHDRIDVYFACA